MAVSMIENKIKELVGNSDYRKGEHYDKQYIKYLTNKYNDNSSISYYFRVESESYYKFYDAYITIKNFDIIDCQCSCTQFYNFHHCKHISAILHNYLAKFLNNTIDTNSTTLTITKNILKKFLPITKDSVIKEQAKLEIELISYTNKYYNTSYIEVKLKIGVNKMYQLNSKFHNFINAYKESREFSFGQGFNYDPCKYYFSNEDKDILDYFIKKCRVDYYGNYYYSPEIFQLDKNRDISNFFHLLENKNFSIQNLGHFNGIIKDNPIVSKLSKKDDGKYLFKLTLNNMNAIDDELKYIAINDKLYELDNKTANIIMEMLSNRVDHLVLETSDLVDFSKAILPNFKNNIIIDDSAKDVAIMNDPIPKLYFDFLSSKIVCNLKFDYDSKIINFFDKTDKIIRRYDLEEEVLHDLLTYDFVSDNKEIYLDDIDKIGNFIENDLKVFTEKYEVFTSQKLKDTNIIKNNKITSQFSIGKDNIMSYSFDLGEIDSEELLDVFDSMKQKKKYYKLKNGSIIDINTTELNQLQNLIEDMDINNTNIKNGTGVIPKYRAIYLDSLKNTKYSIIKTNNLFDELISKFKKYKDASIDLSKRDINILRDYQVLGVKWLTNIHRCGFGGILADEMGLGKSIQVIYFIKQILKEKSTAKILIISPTSLVYNWQNEFDKFGNELKYKAFAGFKNTRLEELKNLNEYNILITTYGLLRQDEEIYQKIHFDVCVIDEAQNIKNVTTKITKAVKEINADTKIALSGTPLENSVLELWSIFDFIMPGYLANITKFKSRYNIKNVDDDLKKLDTLNKQISAFILRRKKSDVILELPEKLENNIYLDLYPEQKKLYAAQVEKTKKEMDEMIKEEGFQKAKFKILQLLTKLRQICIEPKLLYENYNGGSCKIDNLITTVKTLIKNGHKILIFTSFKTALEIAKTEFNNNNITNYVIDGSISAKKRIELVDKFNNDDTNVFLIMLKAGGTGLNLTSADVVIHLDLWWNPQAENQATDRAHRIGQKNTVEVIKFICKGTIEERIIELQKKKKILSDSLIDGKNRAENVLSTLSEKDLKSLIAYNNE